MTFEQLYTRFTDLSRNTATSPVNNETLGKSMINESHQTICALRAWTFLETETDITSAASTSSYELPARARSNQVVSVRFEESATVIYPIRPVYSATFWEYLQSLNTAESDVPLYYYIFDEKIHIYPTIASASKTIRVRHRKIVKDMTQDNYFTGTITTATNGDETIVGDSTVWTNGMAGNYLRITAAAAAAKGDGYWYEIDSITDNTNLELVKNYAGTTLAAASAAYTIGEMTLLPVGFEDLTVYRSLALYFMQNNENLQFSDRYWHLYDGGYEAGLSATLGGKLKRLYDSQSGTTEGVYIPESQEAEPHPLNVTMRNHDYLF